MFIVPTLIVLSTSLGWLLLGQRFRLSSLLERVTLYSLCGCVAFSWVGTLLAGLGVFHWWLLFPVLIILVVINRKWRSHSEDANSLEQAADCCPPRSVQALLGALLAGVGWVFAHPAESFFVFNDAAVYTIGGVVLARTGSLLVRLNNFWQTYVSGDFLRQFYFVDHFGLLTRHYGPFYQWLPWNPTLEIGFLPLPKVWMALNVWLFGPPYATWATPFFGLLSLAVLFHLVNRLLGWKVGLGAVLLLGVSLPQIWFARYPISEIYTQAFIVGGLYLLLLARQNADRPFLARQFVVWSGLSLATLTILRLEGSLLLLLFIGFTLTAWYRKYARWPDFTRVWLSSLVLAGGLGTVLSIAVARYYFFTRLLEITPGVARWFFFSLLIALSLAFWLWRRPVQMQTFKRIMTMLVRYLPPGIAVGWMLWVGMAGWRLYQQMWANSIPGWLTQYWSWQGMVVSLLGLLWLLWQDYRQADLAELSTLLGVAMVITVGFTIRTYVFPLHPWAVRRLMPVVFPALAVTSASFLAFRMPGASGDFAGALKPLLRPVGNVLSVAVITLLTLLIAQRSLPLLFHRERAGLWRQLQTFADHFPADAVLLFDNGSAQGLTQAMELIFSHPSLVIQQTPPSDGHSEVDALVETAMAQDRTVYLIVTDGHLAWWPSQWRLVSETLFEIAVPVLRQPAGRLPVAGDIATQLIPLDVYRIQPREAEAASSRSFLTVPAVGPGSYLYLRDGFYQGYTDPSGISSRWTDGDAMISLPWPPDTDFCLQLELAGGRPDGMALAHLTITVEDAILFDAVLDPAFTPQTLMLPVISLADKNNDAQLDLWLSSTTWDAASVGDDRILGVLFYGAKTLSSTYCLLEDNPVGGPFMMSDNQL